MKFRALPSSAWRLPAAAPLQPARAEVSEVRLAQQFSMYCMLFAMQGR